MIPTPRVLQVAAALCASFILSVASPLLASEASPGPPKEKVVQRDKLLHEGVEVAFSIEPDFWKESPPAGG